MLKVYIPVIDLMYIASDIYPESENGIVKKWSEYIFGYYNFTICDKGVDEARGKADGGLVGNH